MVEETCGWRLPHGDHVEEYQRDDGYLKLAQIKIIYLHHVFTNADIIIVHLMFLPD